MKKNQITLSKMKNKIIEFKSQWRTSTSDNDKSINSCLPPNEENLYKSPAWRHHRDKRWRIPGQDAEKDRDWERWGQCLELIISWWCLQNLECVGWRLQRVIDSYMRLEGQALESWTCQRSILAILPHFRWDPVELLPSSKVIQK